MAKWVVIDRQTGMQVGRAYDSLKAASRKANRLDLEYGAVRYQYKRIEVQS